MTDQSAVSANYAHWWLNKTTSLHLAIFSLKLTSEGQLRKNPPCTVMWSLCALYQLNLCSNTNNVSCQRFTEQVQSEGGQIWSIGTGLLANIESKHRGIVIMYLVGHIILIVILLSKDLHAEMIHGQGISTNECRQISAIYIADLLHMVLSLQCWISKWNVSAYQSYHYTQLICRLFGNSVGINRD